MIPCILTCLGLPLVSDLASTLGFPECTCQDQARKAPSGSGAAAAHISSRLSTSARNEPLLPVSLANAISRPSVDVRVAQNSSEYSRWRRLEQLHRRPERPAIPTFRHSLSRYIFQRTTYSIAVHPSQPHRQGSCAMLGGVNGHLALPRQRHGSLAARQRPRNSSTSEFVNDSTATPRRGGSAAAILARRAMIVRVFPTPGQACTKTPPAYVAKACVGWRDAPRSTPSRSPQTGCGGTRLLQCQRCLKWTPAPAQRRDPGMGR